MTQEVDALIAYFTDSGLPFHVTDINTPGVHAKDSFHYAAGTHSASGTQSTAIDLAAPEPSRDSGALDALFDACLAQERNIAELVYGNAPFNIQNGLRVPIWDLADNTNTHIHIAVRRGTFLQWQPIPFSTPNSTLPTTEDEDMAPQPTDKAAEIVYNPTQKTQVNRAGQVFALNTVYMGGIDRLLPEEKTAFTFVGDITALDPNRPEAGYIIWDGTNWDQYKFDAAKWAEINGLKS